MKTVLVTGASGFVGGHVVAALAQNGIRPRCLVSRTSRLDFIQEWSPELAYGDVASPESLESAVQGVDGIVHCAGAIRALSPADFMRVNADGCRNLYAACLAKNPDLRRIVHIGSLTAYGPSVAGRPVQEAQERRPVSSYGRSKLAGQLVAEAHTDRLPIAVLVPPAVYGPSDRAFLKTFAGVKRGFALAIGREERWASLIYAKDLARAVLACLENTQAAGNTYLVEDGHPYTWQEVAVAIGQTMHKSPLRIPLPIGVAKAAGVLNGWLAGWTGKPVFFDRDRCNDFLQPAWTCSAARIRAELGFAPRYSLAQGLEETYRWYQEHHWL